MADRTPEPRIASHDDDPAAPLADRLLLALGMWPSYVDELGVDVVLEATVIIRNQAHRFPMAAEDYGHKAELLEATLTHLRAVAEGPEGVEAMDAAREFLQGLDDGEFDGG